MQLKPSWTINHCFCSTSSENVVSHSLATALISCYRTGVVAKGKSYCKQGPKSACVVFIYNVNVDDKCY